LNNREGIIMDSKTANPFLRIILVLGFSLGMTVLLVGIMTGPALALPKLNAVGSADQGMETDPRAASSVITVTTTLDDLTDNGNCTLREAIQAANTDTAVDACPAGSGEDVIVLIYHTHYLSLTGLGEDSNATGDLDISSSLSLVSNSPGSVRNIRADNIDRVLHITTGGITVTLANVSLRDGFVSGQGGGIYVASNATLNISDSSISDNGATVSGGGMYVGVGSQVSFFDGSMVDNVVTGQWYNNGGAIDNRGNLHIEVGRLVRNTADGVGGAIYSEQFSTLNILDSAIHENVSNRVDALGGGGVFITSNATANIANTTFYLNTANYHGGAVLNRGTLNFTNNTVYVNYADADANHTGDGGGVGLIDMGSFTLKNNLIAGNFDQSPGSERPDITGPLISAGHNLIGNRGMETFTSTTGDLVGTSGSPIDPLISSLPAESPAYFATLVGSPAIDHIPPAYCTIISTGTNPLFSNGAPVPNDVRGILRPQGVNCDIGNYEAEANPSISKDLDINGPTAGQTINYTVTVSNNGVLTLTDGVVSDAIPAGLVLAGPISLNPSSAGTVGSSPEIVTDLTVAPSSEVNITIPAQVQGSVAAGTRITNTASLTAADLEAPLSDSVVLAVSECQTQIDGNSTIYATVQAAVSSAVNNDLIKIAGYCAGTELAHGTKQLAYLDKDLTLQGGHPLGFASPRNPAVYPTILDAAGDGRVFWVPTVGEVALENLILQGGLVSHSGGGIYIEPDAAVTMSGVSVRENEGQTGGGVLNRGVLTIDDSTLEDNRASSGGAIYNQGPLTITESTIRDNSVTSVAGGIYNITPERVVFRGTIFDDNQAVQSAGAIFNDETADLSIDSCQIVNNGTENYGGAIVNQNLLEIKDTLIANNNAGQGASGTGGAIANFAQMLGLIRMEILSSTIVDNSGGGHGGGIYMPNGGTLTITQSTISRNQSGGKGGGIYLANDMFYFLYGRVTLANSTISLNEAEGDGGGVWAVPQDLTVWVSMTHVTLAGNQSTSGSGGGVYSDYGDANITYENTLLAGNTAGGPGIVSDCAGSGIFSSQGYNLVGGGGGCPTVGTDQSASLATLFSQEVSLELMDHGGPSLTHALLAGGVAVDAVPLATCLPVDQRGVNRPVGPLCDIGAYELARQLFLPSIRKNTP
jgi:CSLREA domain-containing protein/uncharacterized repeat protein (TIGR01451 family)